MKTKSINALLQNKNRSISILRRSVFIVFLVVLAWMNSCNSRNEQSGDDNIGGTVTGPKGPEAGVWVIAETNDLPTRFAKIVVTDDNGNYLIPDLPSANYSVWVRGYGLVDSPKKEAKPGATLNLEAVAAPDERAAAEYYPAGYWFSLLNVPDKAKFPGTGPEGNGVAPTMLNQAQFLRVVKSGTCLACHALGVAVSDFSPRRTERPATGSRLGGSSGPAALEPYGTKIP